MKELLTLIEALDSPLPFTMQQSGIDIIGTFKLNEMLYRMKMTHDYSYSGEDVDGIPPGHEYAAYTLDFSADGSHQLKNTNGKELTVFATVLEFAKKSIETINKKSPNVEVVMISFSADKLNNGVKTNRGRLYARLANAYAPPGWVVDIDAIDEVDLITMYNATIPGMKKLMG